MKFGNINHFMLFGGGQLLFDLACELANANHKVNVITSRRHALSSVKLQSKTMDLVAALDRNQIPYTATADVETSEEVIGLISDRTLGISISAEWIFNKAFISRFQGGLVNLHGSRLPFNRGAGGFSWVIMQGDRLGGVTLHLIDPSVDTGRVIASKHFTFPESCTKPADFHACNSGHATSLLNEFVGAVQAGKDFDLKSQENDSSTLWPRLNTETHGFIDWQWKLGDISRFICAFDAPYKGASTFMNGELVHLKDCCEIPDEGPFHPFQAGMIYRKTAKGVAVATSDGGLMVQDATDDQEKSVLARLRAGHRFYTPRETLERALQYRAVYPPQDLTGQ